MSSKIVVGVDGSEGSLAALRWAWREARVQGASLHVVSTWTYPSIRILPGPEAPPVPHDLKVATGRMVNEMLAKVSAEEGGDVHREVTVTEGPPAVALLAAAEKAELLVVGARGVGGFHRLLLGSVSQQCVQHSPCPVVVVRQTRHAVA